MAASWIASTRSCSPLPSCCCMSLPPTTDRRLRVAVLGSTGSIGTQALDVLGRHPDAFEVVALATGRNETLLAEQAARHGPRETAVTGADVGRLEAIATRD